MPGAHGRQDFAPPWARGAQFVYVGTLSTDNAAGGNLTFFVTPALRSRIWVLWGQVLNNDTVARTCQVYVDDGAGTPNSLIDVVPSVSIANGKARRFPTFPTSADNNEAGIAGALILTASESATARLRLAAIGASFAQNQTIGFRFSALVWGSAPTVTSSVSAGAATQTDTTKGFY